MPEDPWSTNGGPTPTTKSDFGTFLLRSVQDTTSQINSDCGRAGIKVNHRFQDGRGIIQMTGATERALEKVKLYSKTLESGVRTASVSLAWVSVDFIARDGTPITIAGGVAAPDSTNWDPVASGSNEMIVTSTMNIATQMRRKDAYSSNSEYQLLVGSDADSATRSLADLYENPIMDTTGIQKTFSAMIWVYM